MKYWKAHALLGVLALLLFAFLIVPYWSVSIYHWDSVGHVLSAKFVREHAFPGMIAWNPMFYAGYAHNQFYPPLFSYVVAALSYLLGLDVAFRLVVSLCVLALPWGFFRWGRSFGLDMSQACVFAALSLAVLAVPSAWLSDLYIGGNFDSLFSVGLVTNSVGLCLLLFYMAEVSLLRKDRLWLASVLLALLVLCNVFMALVGIIFFISCLVAALLRKEKSLSLLLVYHSIVGALLSSFWTLPLLMKRDFSYIAFMPVRLSYPFVIVMFLFCVFCFYAARRRKDFSFLQVSLFMLFLFSMMFLINTWWLGLHAYRFQLLFFIVFMLILVLYSKRWVWWYGTAVVLLLVLLALNAPLDVGHPELLDIHGPFQDRTLVMTRYESRAFKQSLEHLIPVWNGVGGGTGLFIESSLHGYLLSTMKLSLSNTSFVWGVASNDYHFRHLPDDVVRRSLAYYFDVFAFNSLFTDLRSSRIPFENVAPLWNHSVELRHRVFVADGNSFQVPDTNASVLVVSQDASTGLLLPRGDSPVGASIVLFDDGGVSLQFRDGILNDRLAFCVDGEMFFGSKMLLPDYRTYVVTAVSDEQPAVHVSCALSVVGADSLPLNMSGFSGVSVSVARRTDVWNVSMEEFNVTSIEYYLYQLPRSDRVSVIREPVYAAGDVRMRQWRELVDRSFMGDASRAFYVRSPESFVFDPKCVLADVNGADAAIQVDVEAPVEITEFSSKRILFDVPAVCAVPVLVKMSYFPNWRAYKDGVPIPLFEVSPHMMMVYEYGRIELRYELLWYEYAGMVLSVIGLFVAFYLFWRRDGAV